MTESTPVPRTRVVKYAVWGNCALLIIGGFFSFLFNIINFLDPTLPVLSAYMCIFGVIALGGELNFRVITQYFGFLHDWIGEAIFFIFVGTLGIGFGTDGILGLVMGVISAVVGVMCLLDHFMCTKKLFFAQTGAGAAAGATATAATFTTTTVEPAR